jgi:hypothetical protein
VGSAWFNPSKGLNELFTQARKLSKPEGSNPSKTSKLNPDPPQTLTTRTSHRQRSTYAEVLKRSMASGGVGRERSQEDEREQANRGRQSNLSAVHNTGSGTNSRLYSSVVQARVSTMGVTSTMVLVMSSVIRSMAEATCMAAMLGAGRGTIQEAIVILAPILI